MTADQSFRAAILDRPGDDLARLVYADFLADTGRPAAVARADLVRAQVEFARLAADPRQYECAAPGVPRCADPACPTNVWKLAVAAVRAREAAVLSKWAARLLPGPLRPGYPALRVSGSTVAHDALHGYVVFERGFIGRVGAELPWRPDAAAEAIGRFARQAAVVFAGNPLHTVTVSFDGAAGFPTLAAEVTHDNPGGVGPFWRVGWDMATYAAMAGVGCEPPVTTETRRGLSKVLAAWLEAALAEPARLAAVETAPEEFPEGDPVPLSDTGHDFADLRDEGYYD